MITLGGFCPTVSNLVTLHVAVLHNMFIRKNSGQGKLTSLGRKAALIYGIVADPVVFSYISDLSIVAPSRFSRVIMSKSWDLSRRSRRFSEMFTAIGFSSCH